MYRFPLAFQRINGCSDEGGENGDREEGNEISGGGKRVENAWPLYAGDLVLNQRKT